MVKTDMTKTEMALSLSVYKKQIEELQKENTKLKRSLKVRNEKVNNAFEWFNSFVDFVGNNSRNIYNEACEYADNKEAE